MDKVMDSASSKFLLSNVYTDSQTEEETETKDTGIVCTDSQVEGKLRLKILELMM